MNRQTKSILATLIVLGVGWIAHQAGFDLGALPPSQGSGVPSAIDSQGSSAASGANQRIEEALARRESGFMVTVDARVAKILPDDRDGSRHQRFLIELATGRSILIAHNIDLAKRVPLERGDRVRLRGQFEWNEKGGVIHWTHRDPKGHHEGGWIEHAGSRVD